MGNLDEMGCGNISSSNIGDDQINAMEFKGHKADSFMVDIEQISSPHSEKEKEKEKDVNPNSRITLQKCLSRKGMQRGGSGSQKGTVFTTNKERGHSHTPVALASPRAAASLQGGGGGGSMAEKPMVGATDESNPQLHNSITIMTGGGGAAESKVGSCRRSFSFRRPPSWTVNPRRILFFFATISSMGTILLIYFTLSISKLNGDEILLN